MSRKEFEELSVRDQGVRLIDEGRYIAKRTQGDYYINLYSFYELFVEIWYSHSTNRIYKIDVLDDIDILDIYIQNGLSK